MFSKRSVRIPYKDFGIKCGASGAKRKEKAAEEKEEEQTQGKEKESATSEEKILNISNQSVACRSSSTVAV